MGQELIEKFDWLGEAYLGETGAEAVQYFQILVEILEYIFNRELRALRIYKNRLIRDRARLFAQPAETWVLCEYFQVGVEHLAVELREELVQGDRAGEVAEEDFRVKAGDLEYILQQIERVFRPAVNYAESLRHDIFLIEKERFDEATQELGPLSYSEDDDEGQSPQFDKSQTQFGPHLKHKRLQKVLDTL
ncbi:hypothetical protein B0O99DRAFT_223284 [Bisporella sp. PMI_857]|nr:hypothetical protein B0O99DRAFT_223284 [Bisporella sp. PMI_857]